MPSTASGSTPDLATGGPNDSLTARHLTSTRTQSDQPRETVQVLPASFGLYPSEIEALRHAVSDRVLKDEGWTTDAEGRVISEAGRPVYKPGYMMAIRKIIGEGVKQPNYTAAQFNAETKAHGGMPIDTDWDRMPDAGKERLE